MAYICANVSICSRCGSPHMGLPLFPFSNGEKSFSETSVVATHWKCNLETLEPEFATVEEIKNKDLKGFKEFNKGFAKIIGGETYTHWAYCPKLLEPMITQVKRV